MVPENYTLELYRHDGFDQLFGTIQGMPVNREGNMVCQALPYQHFVWDRLSSYKYIRYAQLIADGYYSYDDPVVGSWVRVP